MFNILNDRSRTVKGVLPSGVFGILADASQKPAVCAIALNMGGERDKR